MAPIALESIYVGAEGRLIRALPPPPDSVEGATEWERLLAVAEWATEENEELLTFYNVVLSDAKGRASIVRGDVKRRFIIQGAATAMQVSDLGQRGALVVVATSSGRLYRLQLVSSSFSRESQWKLLDGSNLGEDRLTAWQKPHNGEVAGLDVWRDSDQAVSVGRDGAVSLSSPLADRQPEQLQSARASVSYTAVKWASPTSFVTAGTSGGLEIWDQRSWKTGPCLRSPLSCGHTGFGAADLQQGFKARMTSLDVHPSRPHLCATGATGGGVAIWDLRFQAAPLALPPQGLAHGDVTEVHFDSQASAGNGLLLSTQDGCLISTAADADQPAGAAKPGMTTLVKDVHNGIPSFACDPVRSGHMFCLAGWECLLYAHRT